LASRDVCADNDIYLCSFSGRRWRCNICGLPNDTPSQYYCHLRGDGRRNDTDEARAHNFLSQTCVVRGVACDAEFFAGDFGRRL